MVASATTNLEFSGAQRLLGRNIMRIRSIVCFSKGPNVQLVRSSTTRVLKGATDSSTRSQLVAESREVKVTATRYESVETSSSLCGGCDATGAKAGQTDHFSHHAHYML
jgi:hypothetical protein